MEYDKSRVELVIMSLVDGDLIKKWNPEGFEKFTHLQEVCTERFVIQYHRILCTESWLQRQK
jgi:hypothetical protein